jgi:predicted O-methyltransferase YrrM
MNHAHFTQHLPALYEDWTGPTARPRSPRFADVLSRVRSMSTPGVLQLLNFAVACLEHDEIYAEVGCFQGSTLIGALLGHPNRKARAGDNFSQFDPHGENREALRRNLEGLGLSEQVQFHNQDFESFLLGLRSLPERIGVFFYDGGHDYRSQLLGLLLAAPLLARRALLVVDDANWPAVRQATWDFLAARPEARLLFDLPTPGNKHPTFWNGLLVLTWDAEGRNGYDQALLQRGRQPALVASIAALQRVNLTIEGKNIRMVPAG